eukprot:Clim_evm20s34 gene=Clim_evmTU20s34
MGLLTETFSSGGLVAGVAVAVITVAVVRFFVHFRPLFKIPTIHVHNPNLMPYLPLEWYPWLTKNARDLGGIYVAWSGPMPLVFIQDADYAAPIFRSQVNIRKSLGQENFRMTLGQGLLTNTGDTWKFHRRGLTPTFHFDVLKDYMQPMQDCIDLFTEILTRKCHGAKGNIDLFPMVLNMTLDIFNRTSMDRITDVQTADFNAFSHAFETCNIMLSRRIGNPLYTLSEALWLTTADGKECRLHSDVIDDICSKAIMDRRLQFENGEVELDVSGLRLKKGRISFIDLLITSKKEDGVTNLFTHEEIMDEVRTFMFAGHDTTAVTIAWMLWEIAQQSHIQEHLQEEIDEFLFSGEITFERLKDLPYMDACIREATRKYPAATIITRNIEQTMDVQEYTLPAGTQVLFFMPGIMNNPKHWKNPQKYNPDRFIGADCEVNSVKNPMAMAPFSAGPRNCIGQKFAMQIMRLFTITFFSKFSITTDITDNPYEMVVVGKPHKGVPVTVAARTA